MNPILKALLKFSTTKNLFKSKFLLKTRFKTAKSVLMRPQDLRPGARVLICPPLATPLAPTTLMDMSGTERRRTLILNLA